MKFVPVAVLSALALSLVVAPAAWADDDYTGLSRAIAKNLESSRTGLKQLAAMQTSAPAAKGLVEQLAPVWDQLESQYAEFAKIVPDAVKAANNVRVFTADYNKAVRLYNRKCAGRSAQACTDFRAKIIERKKALAKKSKALKDFLAWGQDIRKRTGLFDILVANVIKELKNAPADSDAIPELTESSATATTLASASSGSVSFAEVYPPADPAEKFDAAATMSALQAMPQAPVAAEGGAEPLAEAPLPAGTAKKAAPQATGKCRWVRVRVCRRFGPFTWTQCCWRLVRDAK